MTPALNTPLRELAEVTEMHRTELAEKHSRYLVLENKNFWDEHDKAMMRVLEARMAHLRRMIKIGEGAE